MHVYKPRTWPDFIRTIDEIRKQWGSHSNFGGLDSTYRKRNRILFRGQLDARWELQTTLERKYPYKMELSDYYEKVLRTVPEVESFTNKSWGIEDPHKLISELRENRDYFDVRLPAYDYLVYLRHHGFASPLLDWSESPFIAAFFAYTGAEATNPAVYCYIEQPEGFKIGESSVPRITLKGPYVKTDPRHFAQKAWYTIATNWNNEERRHSFCPHESVFGLDDKQQDILIKIILPIGKKVEALQHLNDYNINHFTLFQSEDSLIKAMESKLFDLGEND